MSRDIGKEVIDGLQEAILAEKDRQIAALKAENAKWKDDVMEHRRAFAEVATENAKLREALEDVHYMILGIFTQGFQAGMDYKKRKKS